VADRPTGEHFVQCNVAVYAEFGVVDTHGGGSEEEEEKCDRWKREVLMGWSHVKARLLSSPLSACPSWHDPCVDGHRQTSRKESHTNEVNERLESCLAFFYTSPSSICHHISTSSSSLQDLRRAFCHNLPITYAEASQQERT
jgi:hypothetical protein